MGKKARMDDINFGQLSIVAGREGEAACSNELAGVVGGAMIAWEAGAERLANLLNGIHEKNAALGEFVPEHSPNGGPPETYNHYVHKLDQIDKDFPVRGRFKKW